MPDSCESPLVKRLKNAEGKRLHAYLDTAEAPNVTIGWGHNLATLVLPPGVSRRDVRLIPVNGITEGMAEQLLLDDIADVVQTFGNKLPWFFEMDVVRRDVLTELGFVIGAGKVMSFKVFMDQLSRKAYLSAAENMRGWAFYRQVGEHRAEPLCRMLSSGVRE